MKRNSIVGKLMLLFFLVGVASLSTIGIYSYYKAKKAILQRTLDQLTSIRTIKKGQVEFFFSERFNNIRLLSQSGPLRKEMADITGFVKEEKINPDQFLMVRHNALRAESIGFSDLFFLSGRGTVYRSTDTSWVSFSGQEFKARLEEISSKILQPGSQALTDLFNSEGTGSEPVCLIGTGVDAGDGTVMGILAGVIQVKDINEFMLEDDPGNGLGESGETYLVGPDYLMRSNSRFIPNSVLRTRVNTVSVMNAYRNQEGSAIIDDYRAIPVLSSYSRLNIPGLEWVILAEIDYEEAMIPIISIRNDLVLIAIIVAIFIFSLAQIISRTITQPVIRLKNAVTRIGEGNFEVSINDKSKDEIGVLSRSFEEMARQLKAERIERMTAMYDGQELERQRLSRELHDGLGQMLVAMKMKMENLDPADREPFREEVNNHFSQIIREIRRVSYDLTPAGLYDFNVDIAIKTLCGQFRNQSGVTVEFTSFGSFTDCQGKVKSYLFRIAQEALHNAFIHSQAGKIEVNLMESGENIVMMVGDNGVGFNYSSDMAFPGNGIYNMRERCRILGGSFDMESSPGKGTTLRVKVPVKLK